MAGAAMLPSFFFFQSEDGIRYLYVTGVQTCALPISGGVGVLLVAAGFLFVVGDALPRSVARLAPELADAALPLARRTLMPFAPLLMLLAWVDRGLHGLVTTTQPLQPELGAAQRDMLLGIFTLADA